MNVKTCKICKIEKNILDFYSGYRCKKCSNLKSREYYQRNKNYLLELDRIERKNRSEEEVLKDRERGKIYWQNNKEKLTINRQKWAENNREKDNAYKRKWRNNNKNKEYEYQKNKLKTNIGYRITQNLRHRIWMALEGNIKANKTKKLLGCSIEDFKKYLEFQFKDGMSWQNYGKNGWHIGHIIPCAFFDLKNEIEQKVCFYYLNLRPEWEMDNISNNDKLPDGKRARDINQEEKIIILKKLIEKFEI